MVALSQMDIFRSAINLFELKTMRHLMPSRLTTTQNGHRIDIEQMKEILVWYFPLFYRRLHLRVPLPNANPLKTLKEKIRKTTEKQNKNGWIKRRGTNRGNDLMHV